MAGAAAPLLVLWAIDPWRGGGPSKYHAWALSAALLSGLVSAAAGVLLRESSSWARFATLGFGLGTTFGTFVAATTFADTIPVLPLVAVLAALCAGALVLVVSRVFSAHRRLLESRAGSLIHQLDRRRLWIATLVAIVALAAVVELFANGSLLRVSAVAGAALLIGGLAIGNRRLIRKIRAAVERAQAPVLGSSDARDTLCDLGIGEDAWSADPAHDPYRSRVGSEPVIRGSLGVARQRALQSARGDAIALVGSWLCLALVLVGALSRPAPPSADISQNVAEPTVPALPPVRTGSWYSGQLPILVDLDRDGVEDVIGLRWDSSSPSRALFVGAHDGVSRRPLWATEPIASQWQSPQTRLVKSGDVLFLTDSEGKLHLYDLATGRERRPALELGGMRGLCVPPSESMVWVSRGMGFDKHETGVLIDADGSQTASERPKECALPPSPPSMVGKWDPDCFDKLYKKHPELERASTFRIDAEVGLVVGSGADPQLRGYDPKRCTLRWVSRQAFSAGRLHANPLLRNRVNGERLYTLYQLASGNWEVGARDTRTGDLIWYRELPAAAYGTNLEDLFVSAQRVYVARDWRVDLFSLDGNPLGNI